MEYFAVDISSILKELKSDSKTGLSDQDALSRLQQQGKNQVQKVNQRNIYKMLFEQFKNGMVLLLIGAAVFSLILGSYRDALVLFFIVVINALIGFYHDRKSENILASLQELVIQHCLVFREGKTIEIPSEELVSGDIVFLREGDGVPADVRLIDSTGFQTNDFILTGESQPGEKNHLAIIDKKASSIHEQINCAFMGTSVAKGEATGVVYATGMNTQLGKIAGASEKIDSSKTPLQKELEIVTRKITFITIIISIALFVGRLLTGEAISGALIFAIGVAAAMVPEGLPAQISISLALGVSKLAKRKAVVKKLSAVEALGSATVIATDKTGTITKNEMTIINAYFNAKDYIITGTGYEPKGEVFDVNNSKISQNNLGDEKVFFLSGFLSSTGKINPPDKYHKQWYPLGDPTECAFSTLLMKAGFNIEEEEKQYPRIQLFPFDSFRKRSSIIREHKGKCICFIKGSIESLLEISDKIIVNGQVRAFYPEEKEQLLNTSKVFASEAKRIIAIGYKDLETKKQFELAEAEGNIVFAGFVTMIDPPHEEIAAAIKATFDAGLKVIMITGDNEITARSVAGQIGMLTINGDLPEVINEKELKKLSDEEIKQHLNQRCVIFSRVSPDEKLHIVTLLKEKGEIVAVTGDGVNDTLSLKKADIGVAMGKNGSKVAQEAASIVLLNDNFSTITEAIKEGRTIYNNLKKVVLANMIGNVAELTCVLIGFVGGFYKMPLVIMPLHILLIDLIGNMLPILMISFDSSEENIMLKAPRKQGQMLNPESIITISYSGVLKGVISFFAFYQSYLLHAGEPNQHQIAVTVTMVSIVVCQFVNVLSSRSNGSVFTEFLFSNKKLYLGFALSLGFLLLISYIPFFNRFLYTGAPSSADWHFILMGAGTYLILLEFIKVIKGRFKSEKMLSDLPL